MKQAIGTLALLCATLAQAQETGVTVSVGVKAWSTQWTTFGYYPGVVGVPSILLKQVTAADKVVMLPALTVRYRDWVASLSGYPSTDHHLSDGAVNSRSEVDFSGGYYVLPGLALTLGYKRVSQLERGGSNRYVLGGPVLGLNASAALNGSVSIYGAMGLGRLKPAGSGNVIFDADYRLSEVGLAYTHALGMDRFVRAVNFTLGYRMQALTSKEAFGAQDGRDLTQGLTLGLFASF